ncbi:hypothetical protein CEXT_221081, partial [Caerostris extrusa]
MLQPFQPCKIEGVVSHPPGGPEKIVWCPVRE